MLRHKIRCCQTLTSINFHDVTCDLFGFFRCKENDGVGDLGYVTYTGLKLILIVSLPQWDFPLGFILESGVLRLSHAHVQVLIRVDSGGGNTIYTDSQGSQLDSGGFCQ